MGTLRMSSLKAKSMVMRPSGLEKLCKVYKVSPVETSLGKSVVGEGDGHKMKERTHRRACMVLVKGDGFLSSAFSNEHKPRCAGRLTTHSAWVCPYRTLW